MLLLLKYLLQANSGRKLWRKIQKKYGHIDEYTRYILFPENDDEYNAWAIYFLNSWAEIFSVYVTFGYCFRALMIIIVGTIFSRK